MTDRFSLVGMVLACVCTFALSIGAEDSKHYAILVGVNEYKDGAITQLSSPRNDATMVGEALSQAGWDQVLIMTDDKDIHDKMRLFPDRDNIEFRLKVLADQVTRSDVVLFFFSGHGVRSSAGDALLLPFDANRDDFATSSISLAWIQNIFKAKGIQNVLFAIDACRENLSATKGLVVTGVGANEKSRSDFPILFSTTEGGFSYEAEGGSPRLSLFSKYLIEALRTGAQGDGLNWTDLSERVIAGVREYAIKNAINQRPELIGTNTPAATTIVEKVLARAASAATGNFSGVGMNISRIPEGILVVGVFPRGPADMADLRSGDVLLSVDGTSASSLTENEFAGRVRGETGTKVALKVRRITDGKEAEILLTRSPITYDTLILQEATDSLPQVVANILPLYFYEGGDSYKDTGSASSVFEANKARFIYWKFTIQHVKPEKDGSLQLLALWHGPDGNTWQQAATLPYTKDDTNNFVALGWGTSNAGSYKPGAYSVDMFYKGKQVAHGSFTVR